MATNSSLRIALLLLLLNYYVMETDSDQSLSKLLSEDISFQMNQNMREVASHLVKKRSIEKRDAQDDLNDVICRNQEGTFTSKLMKLSENDEFSHKFTFTNETNYSLALAWTGNRDGRLIVAITQEVYYVAKPSRLYLSIDDGKNFTNITGRIDNKYIRKDNGLQNHPNSAGTVMVIVHTDDPTKSAMYLTEDGGENFHQVFLPFLMENNFLYHPSKENIILAHEARTRNLYLSQDKGRTWEKIKDNVHSVKWSTYERDSPETIYAVISAGTEHSFFGIESNAMSNTLQKCDCSGNKYSEWKVIRDKVYLFGMEGKFLYVSKMNPSDNEEKSLSRLMEVSTDGGTTWSEVQLPTVTQDRFYSILDMSEELIFMHVDNPGDTGHGTLYISDATGIIFTESLQRHLYPNYMDITDFYRVRSMRGVYLASQMESDNSIHTMITYDRGGEWQQVRRPEGVPCKDESKACYLQIHNMYSIASSVRAQPPLSVDSAVGLILVHGHVADALQNTDPDVYVSSDGGYNWRLALKGPHHYQIADQGGLLVAVPADTTTPKVVKFSTDEGRCWHHYDFTEEPIVFTRLLTEPGNSAMSVAIWGYHEDTKMWKTHVVDFKKVIDRECVDVDYEDWTAHFDNNDNDEYAGCLLGMKESFRRLKKDSWCYNGYAREIKSARQEYCKCAKADYDCDYGYFRAPGSQDCLLDPSFKGSDLDICYRGHVEELVNLGYHKIPGDVCKGGFTPKSDKVINLKEKCQEGDKSEIAKETHQSLSGEGESGYNGKKNFLIAAVVIFSMLATIVLIAFFVQRYGLLRRRNATFKYSSLQTSELDADHDLENALGANTSLYEDSSDEEPQRQLQPSSGLPQAYSSTQPTSNTNNLTASPRTPPPRTPKVKGYHDDSDDDLLE